MANTLEHVWQPGRIGPLELPHRIVMGAMHMGLEGIDPDGRALAAFYRARAEGGAALIITGGSAVSRVGAGGRNYSFINDEHDARKLATVADGVHAGGARVLLQLFHAGRYALERSFGLQPVAPSAVYSRLSRCEPHALSELEIEQTIADFADGARRARELGFDGVEIMGSEGYLLNQFMAPATNQREDAWGGDSERRMRFSLAVAQAVREAAGATAAVIYRISAVDLVEGGATAEEIAELARRLIDAGPDSGAMVDALSLGIGWHEARVPTVQADVPHGAWTPWARHVREAVDGRAPVMAANRITTLELADAVLAAGDADFVSMARPFLADPEILRKSRDRAGRRVNVCIACNQCIDRSIFDQRVSCTVNPRAGYELEMESAQRPGTRADVAVIGGGPAGLEAARALAVAGYRVTLHESAQRLGGQFQMACRIPGKEDFAQTITYFESELRRLGVRIELGAAISDSAPLTTFDAVVVATGVRPRALTLSGAQLPHVHSYAELLLDPDAAGLLEGSGSVAIIGAGGIGVDVAHLLSHNDDHGNRREAFYTRYGLDPSGLAACADGRAPRTPSETHPQRTVTLMRRHGRIGDGIGPSTRWVVLQELERAGVELLTGVSYERIERDALVITDAEGTLRRIDAQSVVVAVGQEPETQLLAAIEAVGQPHIAIGGAAGTQGLDAWRAFRQGFDAPAAIQQALMPRQ